MELDLLFISCLFLLLFQAKLAAKVHESLDAPALRVASDYFTAAEMAAAKFKKPKKKKDGFGKKKKLKKRTEVLKADDLLALGGGGDDSENFGSRNRRKGGNKGEKEKNSGMFRMTPPFSSMSFCGRI